MNNLVWFGNNLRVADNLSLQKSCSGSRVIGIFCFDPRDRKFHVQKQAEHYDPHGDYQRLWLQESLFGPGNIPL